MGSSRSTSLCFRSGEKGTRNRRAQGICPFLLWLSSYAVNFGGRIDHGTGHFMGAISIEGFRKPSMCSRRWKRIFDRVRKRQKRPLAPNVSISRASRTNRGGGEQAFGHPVTLPLLEADPTPETGNWLWASVSKPLPHSFLEDPGTCLASRLCVSKTIRVGEIPVLSIFHTG